MIVLDVNAAVALTRGTDEGLALRSLMMTGEEILAPRFYLTELGNIAWKLVRAGVIDEEDAYRLLEHSASLVDRFVPVEEVLAEAVHAAILNEHSVYDMLYLVVARRNAATLFTFDKKLRAVCEANGVNCIAYVKL